MPKLTKKDARTVESTDPIVGGDYEPLPAGKYLVRLDKVEARETNNGAPAWNAEFNHIHTLEGDRQPGRQFLWLNLPQAEKPGWYEKSDDKWESAQRMAAGRLHAFFEAFGYTTDSDTDEMLGEWALAQISVRTIQNGPKAGQKTNRVDALLPLPDEIEPPEIEDDEDSTF